MKGKYKTFIALGIIIILIPALGFPATWENTLLVLIGLIVIAVTGYEWWSGEPTSSPPSHTHSLFPSEKEKEDDDITTPSFY